MNCFCPADQDGQQVSDQQVLRISPIVADLKTFASSSAEFQDIKKLAEQVEGQVENVPILTLDFHASLKPGILS